MRFSVITVCLNPGSKLKTTLDSVLGQSCKDFEVIVKDGGSTDGSVETWRREAAGGEGTVLRGAAQGEDTACLEPVGVESGVWQEGAEEGEAAWQESVASGRVRVFVGKDRGIYDAMNRAAAHAAGDFVIFMNCGDVFADDRVLERVEEHIRERERSGADLRRLVLYGDTVNGADGVTIASAPAITGFTCYRNIPCHQSCFYARQLCVEKPYDLQYRIRADYDHFLWCFYRAGAAFAHVGFPVAVYEGGGYSESRDNRRRDREEHRQITAAYMGKRELFRYRLVMALTLAPLRRAVAGNRAFSGLYHWVKGKLYKKG